MSRGSSQRAGAESESLTASQPALGIVATRDNASDVAGAILRAHDEGYEVFVATNAVDDLEATRFADQLGATVIETNEVGRDPLVQSLSQAARHHGHPGLLYHEHPSEPIDFEASTDAMYGQPEYVCETEVAPTVRSEPTVLAAIPAYNEGAAIADVVRGAREYVDEVLVIDDGSTDATVSEAVRTGATVIEHETNKGYGGALKTAFREAKRSGADHLVILDGDGQHNPSDIPDLLRVQREDEIEVVIGSRFAGEVVSTLPLYRRFGLAVVNLLTNLSLGVVRSDSRVRDTQSGFRAYNRDAIESLATDRTLGDNMSASTDILYHAHSRDYRIREVGTVIDYEVKNGSTHSPLSHGISLVGNILKTVERKRPVSALGVPGFVSSIVGIGFGYMTLANYIDSGVFPLGLAMASVFFVLAGIFSCFTAIILHSLNSHYKSQPWFDS